MDRIIKLVTEEIDDFEQKKTNIDALQKIVDTIEDVQIDHNLLSDFDMDYVKKIDIDQKSLQELEIYKMLLQSNMFKLTESQEENVFDILDNIKSKIKNAIEKSEKENKKINNEIKNLSLTRKRISEGNFDYIKEKDLEIIEKVMEPLSFKEQLDVLKQMILLNGKKVNKIKINDRINEEELVESFAETNLKYEDVEKIFNKYGIELEENEHLKNNLLRYGVLENIDSILDFLNKNDILKQIDYKEKRNKQFIDVLSYSNVDIVKKMYDFSKERTIKFDFLLNAPSNFIPSNRQRQTRRVYRRRNNSSSVSGQRTSQMVRGTADFFDKNIILLESIGFDARDVVEYNYSTLSNIHLEEMLQTLMLYGFEIDENIALSGMVNGKRLDYIIDKYIELDLHPYIKEHASGLNNYTHKQFEDIYYTRQANLPVLNENGTLSRKALEMIPRPEESKRIIDLEKKYEEEEMPIEKLYEIEANPDYNDWTKVWSSPEIQQLEKENKVDDFTYKIAGMTISRLKVLRIYNGVLKDKNIDNEKGLLFAVTCNSLLNESEFDGIKKELKERVK